MSEKTKYDEYFMTQQQVADALGTSRANVGSIEVRAIAKLRNELAKRGYKMEDLIGGMA